MKNNILKIGIAINKIAMSVSDVDLERIKPYLEEIENNVLEMAGEKENADN